MTLQHNLMDFLSAWLRWPPLSPVERRLRRISREDAALTRAQREAIASRSRAMPPPPYITKTPSELLREREVRALEKIAEALEATPATAISSAPNPGPAKKRSE